VTKGTWLTAIGGFQKNRSFRRGGLVPVPKMGKHLSQAIQEWIVMQREEMELFSLFKLLLSLASEA
jgi:hypothetical protein